MTVGDAIVYATHGVGLVIDRARMRVAGTERDCIVVELASGLRVTLPIEEAAVRLRAVADDAAIEDIRRTLASEPSRGDGAWTRRVKENRPNSRVAGRSSLLSSSVTVAVSTAPQAVCASPIPSAAYTSRRGAPCA